jgi:7,8-dihydro-6-hydroxymethylpterin dimethyltransferase
VDDAVYQRLRGMPLLETKTAAIRRCAELALGVVLVPTVVPGVNDQALGDILRFGLARAPAVRGVHFQPISYFGRYPTAPADADRITLPEVMRGLERQTGGMVRAADFRPPGAEHARCSFSATFERTADGALRSPRPSTGCCSPRPGAEAEAARKAVARRWTHPEGGAEADRGTNGGGCAAPASDTASLDAFLQQARRSTFSISAMAFQDAWSLDLARVRDCHIHVADEGRLMPFCAYNLTSQGGTPLHRKG